jgi:hypothetical protein
MENNDTPHQIQIFRLFKDIFREVETFDYKCEAFFEDFNEAFIK